MTRQFGAGIAPSVDGLAIALVERLGVRWYFLWSDTVVFQGSESMVQRAELAAASWKKLRALWSGRGPFAWLAVLEPWGILSGTGQDNKSTTEGRRLALLVGQVLGWAIEQAAEPVLFEPGEIRRGLGAQAESDGHRLRACIGAMVSGVPKNIDARTAEAIATAVMGGRAYMSPPVLVRSKRL